MKAIGTLLDGLDDVVEAFAQPVGLAVFEEVQDTNSWSSRLSNELVPRTRDAFLIPTSPQW